jgi:hypothetical protein
VKHIEDQDLMLLAHRSLGPAQSVAAKIHLWRCPSCRAKFGELSSFSTSVASAVRVGLPAWKPAGIALQMKLFLAAIVVAGSFLVFQIAQRPTPPAESGHLDFSSTTNPTKRAALDALKKSRGEKPAVYRQPVSEK